MYVEFVDIEIMPRVGGIVAIYHMNRFQLAFVKRKRRFFNVASRGPRTLYLPRRNTQPMVARALGVSGLDYMVDGRLENRAAAVYRNQGAIAHCTYTTDNSCKNTEQD